MGDMLSLIEKAEQQVDEQQAEDLQKKLEQDRFTLEDFLQQMRQVRKMGPLSGLIGMLPGMGAMKQLKNAQVDDGELDRVEAIILSMTPLERANPALIKGSRRKRIANGSGTRPQQVNQLIKQFDQMRKMMRMMMSGEQPSPQQLAQMAGGAAPRPKYRRR
jgi:signal recognition particle subunit SRP54